MNISVFGGSQMKEGSSDYRQALSLGNALGKLGHTVLTGGYIGAMEAVSRGAAEAGGHVVGVTCVEIEQWHADRVVNRWVQEEWKKGTLVERLQALVSACDAAFAQPGGAGTLTEIGLAWNMMIVQSIPQKPLILVGEGWRSLFDLFWQQLGEYSPPVQRELLQFAPDVETALRMLPAPRAA